MTPFKRAVALAAVGALLAAPPAGATRIYAGQPAKDTPWQMVLSLASNGKSVNGLTFYMDVTSGDSWSAISGKARVVRHMPSNFAADRFYLVAKISGRKLSGHLAGFYGIGDNTAIEKVDIRLTGTIAARAAAGRVRATLTDVSLINSKVLWHATQTTAWRALRNPGVVYGGTTSQGMPVVLELQSSRTGVSHAHITWYAENAESWSTNPHDEFDMVPFALGAGGTFSQTYNRSFPDGTTGTEQFAGRVGNLKAGGTFSCVWTYPSQTTGGTPDTVSSGQVHWTATSG